METGNKKNPPPDKSINKQPEQEPKTSPSTGQHEPDIQNEKLFYENYKSCRSPYFHFSNYL